MLSLKKTNFSFLDLDAGFRTFGAGSRAEISQNPNLRSIYLISELQRRKRRKNENYENTKNLQISLIFPYFLSIPFKGAI